MFLKLKIKPMKNILFLFLTLYVGVLFVQKKEIKKPEKVIISNNKSIKKEKIENLNGIESDTNIQKNQFYSTLKLHVNDTAKDFTVQMINGETIKLSDLKGKVILLNFWATWCSPCMDEFQEIPYKILKPFKNSDFVFIPVSRGESKEKVQEKMLQLRGKGINFNVGIDPDKKIWNKYAIGFIPRNFLIDKNGVIKYISTGYSLNSVNKIATDIKKLLKK